jgi:hypothetical protein
VITGSPPALLAERFGSRVVTTAGTIAQMHANVVMRPLLWDKVYPGTPPAASHGGDGPGQPLAARRTRSRDRRGRPQQHQQHQRPPHPASQTGCRQGCDLQRRSPLPREQCGRRRLQTVARSDREGRGLKPYISSPVSRTSSSTTTPKRTIAETRQYPCDADELLKTEHTTVDFFNTKIERHPNHRRVRSCGPVPVRSTACANTQEKTSARSSLPAGFEP